MNYKLWCSPSSYGFNKIKSDALFPEYTYPKCSAVTGIKESSLHIDREKNMIFMTCNSNSGSFVYGPYSSNTLVSYTDTTVLMHHDNGPRYHENVEFGLGVCKDKESNYHNVVLEPAFNKIAFENAMKKKAPGKPTIIYFLTVDSASRKLFFRKLPKTINYFNNLHKTHPAFVIYDFKLHSVFGHNSRDNQVPIFGRAENYVTEFKGNQNIDKLGKDAIWNMLREKGYISLLGFDDCDASFPEAIGKNPKVDYSVRQFYCYVKKQLSMETAGFETKQRCLGAHMNHYYMLNYTHTVARLNQGVNQWLYIHLNAFHEKSGQHGATLNDDLTDFIALFLKDYGKDNNVIIFLQADHGNPWIVFKGVDGNNELKLPTLFIIANKDFMNNFPYSYHALHENTHRLVLKQDLRETMLGIAGITEKSNESINLLNEIALKSRHCENISLSPEFCACVKAEEFLNYTDNHVKLFKKLKDYAEFEINSLSYSHESHSLRKICKKITLVNITSVYQFQFNNVNELFRLTIASSTREDMEFKIDFFLASDNSSRMNIDKSLHAIEHLVWNHYPLKVRVLYI